MLSEVGDVPVDSEAQSPEFVGSVFEDAPRDRVCVCAFIRMSVRAL